MPKIYDIMSLLLPLLPPVLSGPRGGLAGPSSAESPFPGLLMLAASDRSCGRLTARGETLFRLLRLLCIRQNPRVSGAVRLAPIASVVRIGALAGRTQEYKSNIHPSRRPAFGFHSVTTVVLPTTWPLFVVSTMECRGPYYRKPLPLDGIYA